MMVIRRQDVIGIVSALGVVLCVILTSAASAAIIVPNACVTVFDATPPTITLQGASPVTVQVGATYTDLGASATDVIEGNLTARITTTSNVNTAQLGSYTVAYAVTDSAGNAAVQVVRTVTVSQTADVTKPVIVLVGSPSVTVEVFKAYTDAGATATDNVDGNITARIVKTGDVNTSKLGTYALTYNVADTAGNAADPVNRSVHVIDLTPPVITPK
jgi:hypothetical protein